MKQTNLTQPRVFKQKQAWIEYKLRRIKRNLLARGEIQNKQPVLWEWSLGDEQGEVKAFTRSEAKARVKEILEVKKLPKELKLCCTKPPKRG